MKEISMSKRDDGRRAPRLGAAPSAFLQLSDGGAAELDSRSPRKSAGVLVLMLLVVLAAPLFWVANAQGDAGDQPLAVKSNSGPNSGPGGGDDDDNSGPGGDDDDGNSGPGGGDDDSGPPSVTQGSATSQGGQGTQGTTNDTNNTKTADTGQPSATGTATTHGGDGTNGTSHNN